MIKYYSENVEIPQINQSIMILWTDIVAESHNKKCGNINYIFCDDKRILEVNKRFLKHDFFTDIITFDYTDEDVISGDLYISLETVKSNSKKMGTSFSQELDRVLIHGILHLCGYKDKTPKDEANMRNLENKALEILNKLR